MSNYFQTLNRLERDRGKSRDAAELEPCEATPRTGEALEDSAIARTDAARLATRPATEGLRRRSRHNDRNPAGSTTDSPATIRIETPGTGREMPQQVRPARQPRPARPAAQSRAAHPALPTTTDAQAGPLSAALERTEAGNAEVVPATPTSIHIPEPTAARRRIAPQSLLDAEAADGDGHTPYLKLFDNLRARNGSESVSTLVLVGAGIDDTPTTVTNGLATLARRRSLNVLVADIEEGMSQPVLNPRNRGLRDQGPVAARANTLDEARPYVSSIALNLRGGPIAADLACWLDAARDDHDLTIVQAPSLGASVDGALLARACDGLVIVIDPVHTTKDMLRRSVERAQTIGCRILGLVMKGTQSELPGWMNRVSGKTQQA
jgi:hypothetical protein